MSQNLNASQAFGTESIPKLIIRFALPAIISMSVNSLYNIVDQIFIGQGVGFIGNAATNAAFPFVTFSMALGVMIGDGSAAYFSLNLGRGNREASARGVGTSILMALLAGILLAVVGLSFTEPLLGLFGATPSVMPYAVEYARITMLGLPFVVLSMCINSQARADGSPRYSMVCMLVGCVLNVILDPIFIFVFHWGVAGAAWATIIGQFANFLLALFYLRRFQTIDFSRKQFRFSGSTAWSLSKLGFSGFINQFAITIVVIAMNNTLVNYGAQSIYGSDIPLAAQGIVMKVNQIAMAVIIGVSVGMQPITGFNYGARNYARVKQAYKISLSIATIWCLCCFLVFQLTPQTIINLFGQEDELYNEFARLCFRIFLLMMPLLGFQIVSTSLFQAIGKPLQAAIMSMSRQILFFLPLLLILPRRFGVMGALYAGPSADFLSFLLVLGFVLYELRVLNKQIATMPQPALQA